MSLMNKLLTIAITSGSQPTTLYVTRAEARTLAREITDQLRPIGFDDVNQIEEVLTSDTALIFGHPLRIKPEEVQRYVKR